MPHHSDDSKLYSNDGGVKRSFPYTKGDPASKRAAEIARRASDAKINDATEARAKALYNRAPTPLELQYGIAPPADNRPIREKLEEQAGDPKHNTSGRAVKPPEFNPYQQEIVRLQRELLYHPERSAQINRRLVPALQKSEKFEAEQLVKQEREAKRAEVLDLESLSNGWLVFLAGSSDPDDQQWLDAARANQRQLLEDYDRQAFYAREDDWQGRRKAALTDKANELTAKSRELDELAKDMKARRKVTPETPTETPEESPDETA